MDTKRLAALVAAAETKSMSGAAKRLGYTPPGIVRLINALEADMGFALLVRKTSGVSLTPEGEKLLPIMREVLRCEERVEQTGARIRGLAEGALVVGVQAGCAPEWLPHMMDEYLCRYADIEFHAVEKDKNALLGMLENHNIDCCLIHGNPQECLWTPLVTREVVAWLPKESPLASNASLLLAELADLPLAALAAMEESLSQDLLEARGISGQARYSVSDCASAYSFVKEGVAHCLSFSGAAEALGGDVVVRPLSPRRFVEYGICMLDGPSLAPAAQEFAAHAAQFAQKLPALERSE